MQRTLDIAGWISLFAGFVVVIVSLYTLAAISPWASHYPWFRLDALVRHGTYASPFCLAGWLAFIPSRCKRGLLLPTLGWTAMFVLPLVVVIGTETFQQSRRDYSKPDLVSPADD